MYEIRLTKLSCAAQQVGIVHFYAVTEIKGLSCRLWWMREWRNLLTSTHVGYRSVIRAVASGASLKFGVKGASATNWFSRVNGARDNGIRLYCSSMCSHLCILWSVFTSKAAHYSRGRQIASLDNTGQLTSITGYKPKSSAISQRYSALLRLPDPGLWEFGCVVFKS